MVESQAWPNVWVWGWCYIVKWKLYWAVLFLPCLFGILYKVVLVLNLRPKPKSATIQTGHNCCSAFLWVCLLSLLLLLSLRIKFKSVADAYLLDRCCWFFIFYKILQSKIMLMCPIEGVRRGSGRTLFACNRTRMKRGLKKEAWVSCSLERVSLRQSTLQMQFKI